MCHHVCTKISVTEKILSKVSLVFESNESPSSSILQLDIDLSIRQSFPVGLFCSQKKSKSYFEKRLEAYLYHLQIKFKHKIPLSSTYIIQFYKGDSPLGRKGKRVHSCNE